MRLLMATMAAQTMIFALRRCPKQSAVLCFSTISFT